MLFFYVFAMPGKRFTTPERVAVAVEAQYLTPTSCTKKHDCSRSQLFSLRKRWLSGSPLRTKTTSGRPPKIPAPLMPKLIKIARKNRRSSLQTLCHKVEHITGKTHVNTLRKYLKTVDLKRRRAKRNPLLTPRVKMLRRKWIRETAGVNWDSVIFTDEASVALTQKGTIWVTCTAQERYNDDCLAPAIRKGSALMIWGAIFKGGRSRLVRLEREDAQQTGAKKKRGITAAVYIKSVYEGELLRVWRSQQRRWRGYRVRHRILEDNCRIHKAKKTVKRARQLGFDILFHPPNSPDLNCIENVWAMLKQRLAKIEDLPTNKDALWEVVQREWRAIPQHKIDKCIDAMYKRKRRLRANLGGAIKE